MRLFNLLKLNKLCNIFQALTMVLAISFSLNAQNIELLDDFEHEGAENYFKGYWSVNDDNSKSPDYTGAYKDGVFEDYLDAGNSKITNFAKIDTIKHIYEGFDATDSILGPSGNITRTLKVGFQFGNIYPHWGMGDKQIFGCYVGFGTELVSEGNMINLTGATHISYWAKCSDTIYANCVVATNQGRMKFFSGFYRVVHKITPTWQKFTVPLVIDTAAIHLHQPKWLLDENPKHPADPGPNVIKPFRVWKVTALEWELEGAGEGKHLNEKWDKKAGTICIDDIEIHNFTWHPEDACMECDTIAQLFLDTNGGLPSGSEWITSGTEVVHFDEGAWYAYNDAKDRIIKTTPIQHFSWLDTAGGFCSYDSTDTNQTFPIISLKGPVGPNTTVIDTAPMIKYTLGPKYKKVSLINPLDTNIVEPFVGIGLTFVDEDSAYVYNADSVQGVYFDYKLNSTTDAYLMFSVITKQKFIAEGAKYYVKLPATGDAWKGAVVGFDHLDLPPWDDKDTAAIYNFRKDSILGLQWSIEGDSGNTGTIAIDNVYLLDSVNIIPIITDPISFKNNGMNYKVNFRQFNNRLSFAVPTGTRFVSAKLYNIQGREVALHTIKTIKGKTHCNMPLSNYNLASGTYIFRLNTIGKRNSVFTKAITIMK